MVLMKLYGKTTAEGAVDARPASRHHREARSWSHSGYRPDQCRVEE